MKIGLVIPDRGDRPQFFENCLRMMNGQTYPIHSIEPVTFKPKSNNVDITERYKMGYERLSFLGVDLIAFIENDDWYHPEYLETMVNAWEQNGRPLIIGTRYTIYYHLRLKKYFFFNHSNRSSAMSTCIRPNIPNLTWPVDNDPYTDIHLWHNTGSKPEDRITFYPEKHICIGMKHAVGKVGGMFHNNDMTRWELPDVKDDNGFLQSVIEPVDPQGWEFYKNMKLVP